MRYSETQHISLFYSYLKLELFSHTIAHNYLYHPYIMITVSPVYLVMRQ
jgi:hypothetical protein